MVEIKQITSANLRNNKIVFDRDQKEIVLPCR